MTFVYVAAGGVLGALSRYVLGTWVGGAPGTSFPWATLLVNVSGSLLLGFLMRAFPAWGTPSDLRAFLTIGFCGSFTTFSTFGYETVALVQNGAYPLAATYVAASLALGVAGVAAGITLASALA